MTQRHVRGRTQRRLILAPHTQNNPLLQDCETWSWKSSRSLVIIAKATRCGYSVSARQQPANPLCRQMMYTYWPSCSNLCSRTHRHIQRRAMTGKPPKQKRARRNERLCESVTASLHAHSAIATTSREMHPVVAGVGPGHAGSQHQG